MALARHNGVAFVIDANNFVKIAPFASVEVRRESTGALASLFSDRAGLVGISNPMTADEYGRFTFCVPGLQEGYRIRVTEAASPGLEYTHRNVPIGLFQELDSPLTTLGDLMRGGSTGEPERMGVGSDGYPLVPNSGGPAGLAYLPPALGYNLVGGYLEWTAVGSPTSTLTVEIKTWSGNDPSASEPVWIAFRSATSATGALTYRKITSAKSITINSGALVGTVSGVPFRLWCEAFDDNGTIRLAIINCVTTAANAGAAVRNVTAIYPLAGWGIASATQESDSSDSAGVFYSDGANITQMPYAVLGYGEWGESTGSPSTFGLINAGNWNQDPARTQLFGPGVPLPGQVVQRTRTMLGTLTTTVGTAIPLDNSIPQGGEGEQIMERQIVLSSAANVVGVESHVTMSSAGGRHSMAIFRDAVANAIAARTMTNAVANTMHALGLSVLVQALVSSPTFKVRVGANTADSVTVNGESGVQLYAGVVPTFVEAQEIMG
jgi:hypothetical protein